MAGLPGVSWLSRRLASLDWKLVAKVFTVVFISEMGDKTQVTTLFLASLKPLYVFYVALGSASALLVTSLIETLVGSHVLGRLLKPRHVSLLTCAAFLLLGILLITGVIGRIKVPV